MPSYLYILANRKKGTLYVGVTSDLAKRVWEHKARNPEGFTSLYNVHRLVYYEVYNDIKVAIQREKAVKKWNRAWKIKRIEEENPNWDDLYDAFNK